MKTTCNRIDRSVKFLCPQTYLKRLTTVVPTFAISRAEELKSTLVKQLRAEYAALEPRLLYQAVNEAHALAALTSVPLLVLPDLAEEKVRQAAAWWEHQEALRHTGATSFAA